VIDAVVFDLDGVLVDSEEIWDEARRGLVAERGGRWHDRAQRDMMGMSSREWSGYMHEELGLREAPDEISAAVVRRLEALYRERLPLIPGAADAVRRIGAHWPLAVASSSNRPLIDLVLELSGLAPLFRVTVSSEEVERGKPAADVYLEAARRLGSEPGRSAAIEDSESGIRSAAAAGMRVVAIPNRTFPPSPETLRLAEVTLDSIAELEPVAIEPET
jgi:HAD superfamily hydrolase (TIGR01509 family)